jgi:uncharacterized membrane protein
LRLDNGHFITDKQVKNRVEAITDGIVAIAATIMVLELGVPVSNDLMG